MYNCLLQFAHTFYQQDQLDERASVGLEVSKGRYCTRVELSSLAVLHIKRTAKRSGQYDLHRHFAVVSVGWMVHSMYIRFLTDMEC